MTTIDDPAGSIKNRVPFAEQIFKCEVCENHYFMTEKKQNGNICKTCGEKKTVVRRDEDDGA